jgi:hypothetical protein
MKIIPLEVTIHLCVVSSTIMNTNVAAIRNFEVGVTLAALKVLGIFLWQYTYENYAFLK